MASRQLCLPPISFFAIFHDSKYCVVLLVSFAGFDVVTLANNHLYDFASKGANFTVQVLKRVGIKYFGVNYGTLNSSQASTEHYNSAKNTIDTVIPIRIRLFTRPTRGGLMVRAVNLEPCRALLVRALPKVIVWCSWARHFTLTVTLAQHK